MNGSNQTIEIFGTIIYLPDEPPAHEVYGYGKPLKEQKWVREDLPAFMHELSVEKNGRVK